MTPSKDLTLAGQLARATPPGRGRQATQWAAKLSPDESAAVTRAMLRAGCISRAEWVRRLILQAS